MHLMTRLETMEVPGTLHGLLRQGLDDLREREGDDRYKVTMGFWHRPTAERLDQEPVCLVCLAGSWLSGRGVPPEQEANNEELVYRDEENVCTAREELPDKVTSAMLALNTLREGNVIYAAHLRGLLPAEDGPEKAATRARLEGLNRTMPEYEEDAEAWHAQAERLYEDLKREGL